MKTRGFTNDSEKSIRDRWGYRADEIIFYYNLIQQQIKANKIKGFKINYTKEKFGRYDITWEGGNHITDSLVLDLENATTKICVECGRPGKLRRKLGRVKPLCLKHYLKVYIPILYRKLIDKLKNLFSK